MHRLVVALLAGLAAVFGATPAWGGSFLDPDARVFTLQWSDGPLPVDMRPGVGRLRALPDGSVLFTRLGRRPSLWRLHADGRLERLGWAGPVIAVAAEPAGTALVIRRNRTVIERLHLDARRRSRVADVARAPRFPRRGFRFGALLAAVDDGSIVVSETLRVWRWTPDGRFRRLRIGGDPDSLVPLPGGSFAVTVPGTGAFRVDARGNATALAPGAALTGPLVPIGGGSLVTTGDAVYPTGTALALIGPDGAVTRREWNTDATLGNGDGMPLASVRWPTPVSMAVAADGSLLFVTGKQIRAVVPADSPRPRIAIAQETYRSFADGRVAFIAGAPGRLTLEVRRAGRTIARGEGETPGGEGAIALPAPPAPARHDVRLRLTTASGVAEARAQIDHRATLPVGEGAAAIAARHTSRVADEGGGAETRPGRCERVAPLLVRCVLTAREWGSNFYEGGDESYSTEAPFGTASAELRPDGSIRTEHQPLAARPVPPELRLRVPARQSIRSGRIRASVATNQAARATLSVVIRNIRGERELRSLQVRRRIARPLSAGETWDAALRVPRRQAATVRRWFAAGRDVVGRVQVELETDTEYGPARRTETQGTTLSP